MTLQKTDNIWMGGNKPYIKGKRDIDIIFNERFILVNVIFQAIPKQGKEEGCGEIEHKIPISDQDFSKLNVYFMKKYERTTKCKRSKSLCYPTSLMAH